MNKPGARLLTIVLGLAIILSTIPIAESSRGDVSIEVYNISKRPLTVRVYVYPEGLDLNSSLPFTCPYRDKIVETFYKELLVFRKAVFRFVSEHPEYSGLARIEFINVSSPKQADVTLRVTKGTNESGVLMYRIGGNQPNEIQIDCWYPPRTGGDFPSIMLHEIFHSLGVGHASTEYTDRGEPELMRFIKGETYPSTLDLYALYQLYFGDIKFDGNYKTSITLRSNIEYKMVTPYDVELQQLGEEYQKLKEENEKLWGYLRNASDVIDYLDDENQKLRQENEELRMMNSALEEQVADLWGQLQTTNLVVENLQEENQRLKANLTWCLQKGLELGEKCNQTIRRLVNQYNYLHANYSKCLEYMNKYYGEACWFKMWTLIITATAIVSLVGYYLYVRRYLRDLSEDIS